MRIKWSWQKSTVIFGDPYFWLLTLTAFISLSRLYDHSLLSIFQERDIGRALELSKGHMIFFGPEVIGGGHLPGPFYYMLLALPLSLGFGVTGCWYLMTAMASLAVGFTYSSLKRFLSLEISFLTAATLICVPQFGKIITFFQNYSFMPLLIVLSLGSLAVSFIGEGSERRRSWLLTSFFCALAIQLHMSVIFIIFAAFFIQILGPRIGIQRLPLKAFFMGIAVFCVIVAPYYLWVICRDHGMALGQIPPTFVSLQPANYLSFERTIGTGYQRRSVLQMLLLILHSKDVLAAFAEMVSYSALAILVVLKFCTPSLPKTDSESGDPSLNQAFRVWLIVVLFTSLPAISVILQPHRARYFSVFLFACTFCLAAWAERRFRNLPKLRQPLLLIAFSVPLAVEILIAWGQAKQFSVRDSIYLTVVILTTFVFLKFTAKRRWIFALPLLVMTTMLYRHSDESRGRKGVMLSTARALSDSVIRNTGWNWNEARSKLFTSKVQYQRSLGSIYQERYKHLQKSLSAVPLVAPDGYFFMALREQRESVTRGEAKRWLLKNGLPEVLAKGIKHDKIKLLQPKILPYGILIGYKVLDKLKYPPSFQNVGVNYLTSVGTKKDLDTDTTRSAGPKLAFVSRTPSSIEANSGLRFTFNDCPNGHSFCDIRFDITRRPGTDQLKVVISGDVISQTSPWVSPDWLQEIYDSYVKFSCSSGPPQPEIPMFAAIGVNHGVVSQRVLSKHILGPAERWILNPCASSSILKVEAGYKKSRVTVSRSTFYLDARKLESAGF